jgi:hypothetical protein
MKMQECVRFVWMSYTSLQTIQNVEFCHKKQCLPFAFLRHVTVNKIKLMPAAMEIQHVPYTPLSSYKIFCTALRNINV